MESAPTTSVTLLGRLHRDPADQAAWADFVDRYGPVIFGWCRGRGLQEAEARDVTQEVLLKVFRNMRAFAYDPARSFRGWLYTLTRNAWSDFVAGRARPGAGSGDSGVLELLHSVEAGDDLLKQLDEAFDLELLEVAKANVRPPSKEQLREAAKVF